MDTRTCTLKAIRHEPPDRVPYDIRFTQRARARMADYFGDPNFEDALGNCFTWFRPYPGDLRFRALGGDIWEDEFGVAWNRTLDKDIGVPCRYLITPENLSDYAWPDPLDPRRYDFIAEALPRAGDTAVLVSLGFALFERAWTLVGMENLLIHMLTNKPFVHDLLDRILAYNLGIIDRSCELDIDIVRFGDDWGHQRGLIMGIDLWREFIKPRLRAMFERVRSRGKTVMIHCCGKVDELFEDLIDCGLDIFNPFQPEVMDVADMKRRYGARLCFYGGISTQQTLPYGSVSEVRDEVRRLIDIVGEGGGYIASPAHDIPPDAKPENIAAMIEVLRGQ
jgi:uroporphyrinogen decarboxylase